MADWIARRYGWDGDLGTSWMTDPRVDPVAIRSTRSVGFLFADGLRDV